MTNDLLDTVKKLLDLIKQFDVNFNVSPRDPFTPARANLAWEEFRQALISAGRNLPTEKHPIADWIRELGKEARRFDELVHRYGMARIIYGEPIDPDPSKLSELRWVNSFDDSGRLSDEGKRLLKEFAPKPVDPFAFVDQPPPPTSTSATPASEQQSEGEKPKAGRSKGVPLAEAELRVREWLLKNAKNNPVAITRDAVARATGVSGSTVSRTSAWKAFRERRDANARPKPREVPLTRGILSVMKADDGRDAELAALIEEQKADEVEQERRYKMRRNYRSGSF